MSNNNDLQLLLLEKLDELKNLKRLADSLEELLSMIKGVQPKELAKRAQEHKTARANLRTKKGAKANE